MSVATYIDSINTAPAMTPENVDQMLDMINERLGTLVINNGKTPLLIGQSTPQWMIDQINASKIAYAVIQEFPKE